MSEIFDTVESEQYIAKISYDDCPNDPRDQNFNEFLISKFHFEHRKYNFKSELKAVKDFDTENCKSWGEEEKLIRSTFENDIALIKPVFMYQHGCVSLSYSMQCRWDSGQIGFAVLLKSQIRNLYNVKNVTKKIIEQAEKEMDFELQTYSSSLNGDVFSVSIEDKETEEEVDLCCGIIGFENSKEFAKEMIANLEKKIA